MKTTPILFNADMVRALLIGAKTQTRRVMKVQPPTAEYKLSTCIDTTGNKRDKGRHHWITMQDQYSVDDSSQPYFSCQFGYAGDQLWVRETFAEVGTGDPGWLLYRASNYMEQIRKYGFDTYLPEDKVKWTPSIHMPRKACRIQLEITNIRVERLNDISEADAIAEGVKAEPCDHKRRSCDDVGCCGPTAVGEYRWLWESINGKGSWSANPWVWVIEFEVLK